MTSLHKAYLAKKFWQTGLDLNSCIDENFWLSFISDIENLQFESTPEGITAKEMSDYYSIIWYNEDTGYQHFCVFIKKDKPQFCIFHLLEQYINTENDTIGYKFSDKYTKEIECPKQYIPVMKELEFILSK